MLLQVLTICKRLGWLPGGASRESAYEHLNAAIPGSLKCVLPMWRECRPVEPSG